MGAGRVAVSADGSMTTRWPHTGHWFDSPSGVRVEGSIGLPERYGLPSTPIASLYEGDSKYLFRRSHYAATKQVEIAFADYGKEKFP